MSVMTVCQLKSPAHEKAFTNDKVSTSTNSGPGKAILEVSSPSTHVHPTELPPKEFGIEDVAKRGPYGSGGGNWP